MHTRVVEGYPAVDIRPVRRDALRQPVHQHKRLPVNRCLVETVPLVNVVLGLYIDEPRLQQQLQRLLGRLVNGGQERPSHPLTQRDAVAPQLIVRLFHARQQVLQRLHVPCHRCVEENEVDVAIVGAGYVLARDDVLLLRLKANMITLSPRSELL